MMRRTTEPQGYTSPCSEPFFQAESGADITECSPSSSSEEPHPDPRDLTRLSNILSARSYPMPPRFAEPFTACSEGASLYGGLLSPTRSFLPTGNPATSTHMEGEAAHRQMSKADTFELTPSKKQRQKLLTSKEVDSHNSHETQERRRKQIRVAQRAYRARQNDKLNEAQERIHKLEMTIESMAHAVASLHDKLVESDRLSNDTSIMTQLQETVKICLHSIDDSDIANGLDITEKTLDPISHTGNLETNTSCNPLVLQPRESGQVWLIPVSSFIEQLHVTCIYQGFLALSDSSLSLADLMTPFRFLLATVDRKRLISFFEAALHARLSQQRLEGWDDIPFFSLGGAGTKSTVSATCDGMTTYVGRFHEPARVIKDPLSDLSTRVKEDLDGDWLDMQDLERLLRQRVQHFIALPLQSSSRPSENNMGVAGLIKRLVDKAVCLGRSPGFRRYDVEKALLSNWH